MTKLIIYCSKLILLSIFWITCFFLIPPNTKSVNAATTFFDTFLNGYNHTLWSVRSSYLEPVASAFGIGDNGSSNWSILDSNTALLPGNTLVKFDMKINTVVSELIFSCKTNLLGGQNYFYLDDLRVYIHSNGTASFDSYINGGGWGGVLFNWDNSTGVHSFELKCLDGAMTLMEDDILLSTINTNRDFNPSEEIYFGYRLGDSEFANYQLCDINGCGISPTNTPIPTPTNTPMPTPTNTPIPTPTPTSTPPPTTKVVVIPGMGGSWSESILTCSLDTPGTWVATPKYSDLYTPLMSEIEERGYTVLPFYYDWRKSIPSHASKLASFISSNTAVGEKVMIVGHSMGGLVGRAYLTNTGNDNMLDRLMTVGSPHRGTAPAYGALSGGELWTDDKSIRFIDTILKKWCGVPKLMTDREVYTNLIPSFYDILPIDDYLKDQKNAQFKPIASMSLKNNWLPSNTFTAPFFRVTVGALSGNGRQTINNVVVRDPTKIDVVLGNWSDGKPTQKEKVAVGDGTVLTTSSTIPGATNIQINQDHGGIISSNEGIGAILDFLGLGTPSLILPGSTIEPESTLVVLAYPSWFWVTDPSGKTVNDTQGIIVVANPKNGNYKFRLIPKTFGKTRIAVAQFLKNGQILWKEYTHNGILPKFANITIDQENPIENPIN